MANNISGNPYMFEPEYSDNESQDSDSDSQDSEDAENQWRLLDNSWCTCQNCIIMPALIENRCCKERDVISSKMEEVNLDTCITDHPGFNSICLDEWVLQIAYLQYRQQYRGNMAASQHEKYRYTAYRQFVRFCWGYLGKDIRVTLPSCAVKMIRTKFPSDQHTGFQYPKLK